MRRRGNMLSRTICWSLGAFGGFFARKLMGGTPDLTFYVAFWMGMMLAAAFVHFDPPVVETWERQHD